jgi:hypothetical protein
MLERLKGLKRFKWLNLPAEGWGVEFTSRQPEVGKKAGGLKYYLKLINSQQINSINYDNDLAFHFDEWVPH